MSRSFDTSPLCHEDDAFVAEFITNAVVNVSNKISVEDNHKFSRIVDLLEIFSNFS